MRSSSHRIPHYYQYAEHTLACDLLLPELPDAQLQAGAAVISIGICLDVVQREEVEWLHHWLDGEDATELSLARVADGYLLRFPDQADIIVSDAGEIQVEALPGTSLRSVRHLLLDQVLPRLLAHRGNLVLHASAATTMEGHAILILGVSGQGKSTLATALAAQSGGLVLADDCVVARCEANRLFAVPNYAGLRLWSDSVAELFPEHTQADLVNDYSEKLRIAVSPAATTDDAVWPVAAILVLDSSNGDPSDTEIRMTALDASRACMALVSNSFQLDVSDVHKAYRLLGLAAAATAQLPVLLLRYPREYAALPRVAQTILDTLHHASVGQPWRP